LDSEKLAAAQQTLLSLEFSGSSKCLRHVQPSRESQLRGRPVALEAGQFTRTDERAPRLLERPEAN
jgi:hypothetical protein